MKLSSLRSTESQGRLFDRPLIGYGSARNAVGDLAERLTAVWVGGRRHKTDSRCDYCPDVSVTLTEADKQWQRNHLTRCPSRNFTSTPPLGQEDAATHSLSLSTSERCERPESSTITPLMTQKPNEEVLVKYFESKAAGRTRQIFAYAGRLEKDRRFAAEHSLTYVIWKHAADLTKVRTIEEVEAAVLRSLSGVYIVPFAVILNECLARPVEKLNTQYGGTDRKTYGSGYRINLSSLSSYLAAEFAGGDECRRGQEPRCVLEDTTTRDHF